MKYFLLISILLLFNSCNNSPKKPLINPSEVIEFATVFTYENLDETEKEKIKYGCYCYRNSWRNGTEFKKENAFFVKSRINNNLLAELSANDPFTKDKLITSNVYSLYGKYHNRWKFINSQGMEICETQKLTGHRTLNIVRIGQTDEVIIGPLPEKPTKMIIEIMDSKYYPDLTPEFEIK